MTGNTWLASFPKSGNTWTRAFLANYLFGDDEPISINEMDRYCAGDADVRYYQQFLDGEDISALPVEQVYAVRPKVHRLMMEHSDGSTFVKIHNRKADFAGVPTITTDATAGAIYVIRNPFDTAISYANHIGKPLDIAIQAMAAHDLSSPAAKNLIYQDLGSWSDHVTTWTNSSGLYMIVIFYEAILKNPVKTFESLVSYLQVPLDKKKLMQAIEFSSFEQLSSQEAKHGFAEIPPVSKDKFFRSGRVGTWRDILNKDQIEYIIRAHGEVMHKFRYLDGKGQPRV